MVEVELADLIEEGREFFSGVGKVVVHTGGQARVLGADEDSEVDKLAEPFVQDLYRNAGDEALKFTGAFNFLSYGGDDRGAPFAADDILEAVVVRALAEWDELWLSNWHVMRKQMEPGGVEREPFGSHPGEKCPLRENGMRWMMAARQEIRSRTNNQKQTIIMKTTATFYHAGCPVCVEAEQSVALSLDPVRFDVEIVHLGDQAGRLGEAKEAGVRSVPALVLGGVPFHINFGAAIEALG